MPVPINAPPGKSSTANRLHSSRNCLCSVLVAELYNNVYNKDEGKRLYNKGNIVGMRVVGHVITPTQQ